jgi:hypothetical protein
MVAPSHSRDPETRDGKLNLAGRTQSSRRPGRCQPTAAAVGMSTRRLQLHKLARLRWDIQWIKRSICNA